MYCFVGCAAGVRSISDSADLRCSSEDCAIFWADSFLDTPLYLWFCFLATFLPGIVPLMGGTDAGDCTGDSSLGSTQVIIPWKMHACR